MSQLRKTIRDLGDALGKAYTEAAALANELANSSADLPHVDRALVATFSMLAEASKLGAEIVGALRASEAEPQHFTPDTAIKTPGFVAVRSTKAAMESED